MSLRQNHIALFAMLVAMLLDSGYYTYTRQLNQQFHMDTLMLLVRLRPLVFVVFYGLLCFAASRAAGVLSPYLLLAIAAVLFFMAMPVFNLLLPLGLQVPAAVRAFITAAASSQLALTFNSGALIVGYGLYQHFARRQLIHP